jgi:hypothetical protein
VGEISQVHHRLTHSKSPTIVSHNIDYANMTRDKARAPEWVSRPHGLDESPLVCLDPYLLQEHLWPLKKLNSELKWTLAQNMILMVGIHVLYSSLAPVCLWTYIFRKACYLGCWCLRYGMIKWTLLYLSKVLGKFILKNNDLASSSMICLHPTQAISWPYWKTNTHAACYDVELCQIFVTLAEYSSYFHDQDHVHSTSTY